MKKNAETLQSSGKYIMLGRKRVQQWFGNIVWEFWKSKNAKCIKFPLKIKYHFNKPLISIKMQWINGLIHYNSVKLWL